MDDKRFTIEDLSELTGFSRRTIRYYIQEGLLEPPAGRGRGGFYYDSHLQKLQQIKSLQDRGLTLAAIAELLQAEKIEPANSSRDIWIRYSIMPGLEINIKRDLEQSKNKAVSEIIKISKALLGEDEQNGQ